MNWPSAFTALVMTVENILILGGTGYAVFVLGASGWWFVLAVLCLNMWRSKA
ncbi:hypothetical protein [Methylobacterium sp. WL19]|uniref:hypothetical protein n=1 Tax=Methylobacterium sp. WL19 TaxID=2603896 RepID=UPI00164F33BF|nr:hypothetical protein [Methylobacterium sp. WL19]